MSKDTPGAAHRVLHVNRVPFLGGVERVILTLASGTRDKGYKAVVACPDGGELAKAARARGIQVAPCSFDRVRITANPLALAKYPGILRRGSEEVLRHSTDNSIDVIHAHHPVGVLYSLRAKKKLGLPIVLHVHEILPARPLYALALRYVVPHVERFICVSGASRDLLGIAAVDPSRVEIVHNGVDSLFLEGSTGQLPAALTGPGPHIGVFGVLEPRKGQHIFLKAALRLVERYPTAHFWIIGPSALKDKAGYYDSLRKTASHPALRNRVSFTGYQEDVAGWMRAMDVVALTSVAHESLSMVLLESLALGRPTVGTAVGGTAEIIKDRETGRVVAPGDDTALASAIEELLGTVGEIAGRKAAVDAANRFSAEVFCNRFAAIYGSAIRRRKEV